MAIALGKYKCVTCVYDHASGKSRFSTFDTSRLDLGVGCLVANTASEGWKFKHLQRRTDNDDALREPSSRLPGDGQRGVTD